MLSRNFTIYNWSWNRMYFWQRRQSTFWISLLLKEWWYSIFLLNDISVLEFRLWYIRDLTHDFEANFRNFFHLLSGFFLQMPSCLEHKAWDYYLATSRDGNVFVADSRGDVEELVFTHRDKRITVNWTLKEITVVAETKTVEQAFTYLFVGLVFIFLGNITLFLSSIGHVSLGALFRDEKKKAIFQWCP